MQSSAREHPHRILPLSLVRKQRGCRILYFLIFPVVDPELAAVGVIKSNQTNKASSFENTPLGKGEEVKNILKLLRIHTNTS